MDLCRRTYCLALVAGVVLTACRGVPDEAPPQATSTGRALARRIIGVPGLQNLAQVNDRLYRGAQPDGAGLAELKKMGVKTVIGLRTNHSTRKEVEAAGLVPVELPLKADVFGSAPPTEEQVKAFFATVLDPARQPVYFHCAFGKDRTGTMAALFRIEVDGWTNEEAIEEMHAFGYHSVYKDLIGFVREYRPRGYAKSNGR
jgi:protein tyrosine/serine phosphatase